MNSAGFERHDFALVAVCVVFVAETDRFIIEADEAVIGDRHAVGVAAEVVEHLCGSGEGAFGVDHPVGFVQRIEETGVARADR